MKNLLLILLFVISLNAVSQNDFNFGFYPKLNVSYKTDKNLKLSTKIESGQLFYNQSGIVKDWDYSYEFTEISLFASTKIYSNSSLNFGYMSKIDEGILSHRLIEQFTLAKNFESFRLGHRFAADQSFKSFDDIRLRLRYRISFETALSGQNIDPKEYYLKFSNEYLYSIKKDKTNFEIRLSPAIGREINKKNKIEYAFDYRYGKLLDKFSASTLWFRVAFYFNVK